MNIKNEINNLSNEDIYSLMLFVLYKSTQIPEYSALSQLAYILDKDSLLKLCEFYGGLTITIPTISQLNSLLNGLLLYNMVDIEGQDLNVVSTQFEPGTIDTYIKIKEILKDYKFNSGRKSNDI